MSFEVPGYREVVVDAGLVADVVRVDVEAFAFDYEAESGVTGSLHVPYERTRLVLADDGSSAAVHGSYPFTLPVPGGSVACGGLTWVGVRPAHRRRGLARAMVTGHLRRCAERDEPVSLLFAAEEPIYGRFGYGRAADGLRLTVPRGSVLRPLPSDADWSVSFAPADAADASLIDVAHRRAGHGRPGWVTRDSESLRGRPLEDWHALRHGGEPLHLVAARDTDGQVGAYALVRRIPDWRPEGARFRVEVREATGWDPGAYHRMWAFLLDLDLTATVETPALPVDDPLPLWLADRRGALPRLADNVHLRLVDLPTALAARRYAAPVDVVLDVTDALLPANVGRWHLQAGPRAQPTVARTDAGADLALDVRELGAAYLGGVTLRSLADAGLVHELSHGVVDRTSTAFGWSRAPFCAWVF